MSRHARRVPAFAPRIPPRLLDEIERLAAFERPIAEIARRVGALADAERLTRPSYEQVRIHVHAALRRAAPPPTSALPHLDEAWEVTLRVRPPTRAGTS